MKLTQTYLKRIIQEELQKVLREQAEPKTTSTSTSTSSKWDYDKNRPGDRKKFQQTAQGISGDIIQGLGPEGKKMFGDFDLSGFVPGENKVSTATGEEAMGMFGDALGAAGKIPGMPEWGAIKTEKDLFKKMSGLAKGPISPATMSQLTKTIKSVGIDAAPMLNAIEKGRLDPRAAADWLSKKVAKKTGLEPEVKEIEFESPEETETEESYTSTEDNPEIEKLNKLFHAGKMTAGQHSAAVMKILGGM